MRPDEHYDLPETYDDTPTLRDRLVRGLALSSLPRPAWLADGILPQPSLTFLYGPPKSGKSFVAIDLAACVATGRPWCSQPTRQGRVLYVLGEGAAGVISRQDAWSMYHGETTALDNIAWYPGPVNVFHAESAGALAKLASEEGASLVVLDTLARCSVGADENSAQDMGRIVGNLDMVRDKSGAAVVVVHHTGKDKTKGMRGSSALLGAADVALEVAGGDGRVRLEVAEAKDFASGRVVQFGSEAVGDSLVLIENAGPARTPVSDTKADELLAILADADTPTGLSASQWRAVAEPHGWSTSSFWRYRSVLEKRGRLVNVGSGKMPRYRPAAAARSADGLGDAA